jgi:UPF0716 protein FxsA
LRAVLFLVVLFILVPIAELYVIIKVGEAIGLVPTLILLIADAVFGSMLLRQQGRAAWIRFNRALAENRLPHKEVFDGVLVIFGGALLITPGFLTDILGLTLLIPPTRALVRAIASRRVRRRLAMGGGPAIFMFGRSPRAARERTAADGPAAGTGDRQRAPNFDDLFSWEDQPDASGRVERRSDDIEGTGHEVRDEDELPPGREPFGG